MLSAAAIKAADARPALGATTMSRATMDGAGADDRPMSDAPPACATRPVASARRNPLRRFLRDDRGVTAVEFGLLALPFFAVLTGLVEISYVVYTNAALQNAVTLASRDIMTGTLQSQGISTAAQFIAQKICPSVTNSISNVDCTKLIVDMRTASAFDGINMSNDIYTGANLKYCPGGPGQITVVRVTYPLAAIFPISLFNRTVGLVNDVPGGDGSYYHIVLGSTLFQTEPYTYSYTPPSTC